MDVRGFAWDEYYKLQKKNRRQTLQASVLEGNTFVSFTPWYNSSHRLIGFLLKNTDGEVFDFTG
jgi:hypothetical protein